MFISLDESLEMFGRYKKFTYNLQRIIVIA